jgi:2'-hydroxyisoflavone reductase
MIGKKIIVNSKPRTVVGVMPSGFRFPFSKAELWTPLAIDPVRARQTGRYLITVARLRPGATSLEATYGPNKALCEQAVRDVYGDRALIGRPGLITGPHDPTDRVPYWPRRIARGGRVLAPGDPADLVQFIDVRDVAAFLADACHAGTAGVFNLTGTPGPFGIFIDLCKTAAYSDAEPVWIPTGRLVAAVLQFVLEIVLAARGTGSDGYNDVDSSARSP